MQLGRTLLAALLLCGSVAACGDDDDDSGGEGEGEGEGESTLAFCTDGVTNDGDDAIDCFDHDCLAFQEDCAPPVFVDDLGDAAPAALANLTCLHDNPPPEPTGETVSVRFYAEDFENQDRIEGATVEVYLGNRIEGSPDFTLGPTDEEGLTEAVDVPARALLATRVLEIPDVAKVTVEFDVETPTEDQGEVRALVVADSTYRVVPAAVAVSIETGKGIVAGRFSDCDDEPVAGLIATIEGQEAEIRYFVDEFPAREPNVTTEDGLYVAINVEPGDHEVVLHGRTEAGGELVELGRREIQVIADSINVVNLEPLAE